MNYYILCPECTTTHRCGAGVHFTIDRLGRLIKHTTELPYSNEHQWGIEAPVDFQVIDGSVEVREIE